VTYITWPQWYSGSVVGRMLPFCHLVLPKWQLPAVAQICWAECGRTLPKIKENCYIPEIQTGAVSHLPIMIMDHLYAYGILLCLHTLTSTCLPTHVVSSPTPDINYYRFSYYLPDSYHMLLTDYYFTGVKITDTRSSGIPELHHTL
jgi:hypothetical protein